MLIFALMTVAHADKASATTWFFRFDVVNVAFYRARNLIIAVIIQASKSYHLTMISINPFLSLCRIASDCGTIFNDLGYGVSSEVLDQSTLLYLGGESGNSTQSVLLVERVNFQATSLEHDTERITSDLQHLAIFRQRTDHVFVWRLHGKNGDVGKHLSPFCCGGTSMRTAKENYTMSISCYEKFLFLELIGLRLTKHPGNI